MWSYTHQYNYGSFTKWQSRLSTLLPFIQKRILMKKKSRSWWQKNFSGGIWKGISWSTLNSWRKDSSIVWFPFSIWSFNWRVPRVTKFLESLRLERIGPEAQDEFFLETEEKMTQEQDHDNELDPEMMEGLNIGNWFLKHGGTYHSIIAEWRKPWRHTPIEKVVDSIIKEKSHHSTESNLIFNTPQQDSTLSSKVHQLPKV